MSKLGDEAWEDLERRWEEFEQRLEQRSGKPDREDRDSKTSGGAPESELVIKRRPKA